jgi:hypothetical protein
MCEGESQWRLVPYLNFPVAVPLSGAYDDVLPQPQNEQEH